MRSRRSGSWALGDVIIGLHIYTRARFDGGPLRHTSVPMLRMGLVGAAPISCSAYVFWGSDYTCIQKCMYSQIVCNGFWRFTFCLHIYTRARFDGGPLRHTSVPMLGIRLVGAAPISCSAYVFWGSDYTCIQKCMYSQIVCNGFWRFTFCLLLECNLFAFYCSIVFLLLYFSASARLMLRCGSPLSPGHDVGRGVSEQSACTS